MGRLRSTLGAMFLIAPACSIEPFQTNPGGPEEPTARPAGFEHGRLDALLRRFVDEEGLVDYRGLAERAEELELYLNGLAEVDPSAFEDDDQRKAYWINAYNAITLAGVLHFHPTRSVRDHPGFWDKVLTRCGGRLLSLDQIEHGILRPMGDPRIHMAIHCASMGCPKLRNAAYTPEGLDAQLDRAARDFLADRTRNRIEDREQRVYLSRIFDWFGEDFGVPPYGGVRGFVRRHALPPRDWFASDFPISFLDYDWSLNDQSRAR